MRFYEYALQQGNHFMAVEYYALMLNRTFLVLVTPTHLVGVKVNGLLSAEGGRDPFTRALARAMAVQDKNNLTLPYYFYYLISSKLSRNPVQQRFNQAGQRVIGPD